MSCPVLSKDINIVTYKTINFLFLLYGCENCSIALRERHNLKVLRESHIGPKREDRENCIMKIFMIVIHHKIVFW